MNSTETGMNTKAVRAKNRFIASNRSGSVRTIMIMTGSPSALIQRLMATPG